MTDSPARRVGGWGFEGVDYPPSKALLSWLRSRVGAPGSGISAERLIAPQAPPRTTGALPAPSGTDPLDRLAHARGQGLADIVRLRTGTVAALPDAVCRPESADQVGSVLEACASRGIRVIPWGGGTSVTGGVNVVPGDAPTVSIDLSRMARLEELDPEAMLATFGPGAAGPAVEAALAPHGLTLGHFPQSWEVATVGGWVATRSAGQESLGYGRIEDMVAGLELVAPGGRLRLAPVPASAAGPDLRQLVLGSEGRLGVITRVTLRVRQRPQTLDVAAWLLPDLDRGTAVIRLLLAERLPLTILRLSDAAETEVALAVGLGGSPAAPLVRGLLRLRGLRAGACLLLAGAAGTESEVRRALRRVRDIAREHGGTGLGGRAGRTWIRDRFRHPYLREGLLDRGWATDTLETAVPWSAATRVRQSLRTAIGGALEDDDERVAVLCHLSHPYRDGTSLYFTFFFRCGADADETIARWARIKRAATEALVAARATISHHHGIGQWHAPWLAAEIGDDGVSVLRAAAARLDPHGILNPHVLLDPTDRLEA